MSYLQRLEWGRCWDAQICVCKSSRGGASALNCVWPVVINSKLGQVRPCLSEHPCALLDALFKDTRNKGGSRTPLNALAIG